MFINWLLLLPSTALSLLNLVSNSNITENCFGPFLFKNVRDFHWERELNASPASSNDFTQLRNEPKFSLCGAHFPGLHSFSRSAPPANARERPFLSRSELRKCNSWIFRSFKVFYRISAIKPNFGMAKACLWQFSRRERSNFVGNLRS